MYAKYYIIVLSKDKATECFLRHSVLVLAFSALLAEINQSIANLYYSSFCMMQ